MESKTRELKRKTIFNGTIAELKKIAKPYFEEEIQESRKELIEDFERMLIKKKWFNKCPDYDKECIQCKFWKDFERLKEVGYPA